MPSPGLIRALAMAALNPRCAAATPDASPRKMRISRYCPSPLPEAKSKPRSEEHTSELQSQSNLVCRLLLEKKKTQKYCERASIQHSGSVSDTSSCSTAIGASHGSLM